MKKLVLLLLVTSVVFGAYINPRTLKWNAPIAADLVGYRLYLVPTGQTIDHLSPHVEIPKETTYYQLPGAFAPLEEGEYKLGIAAYDNNINISDIVEITYFFDQTPPPAVTSVVLEGDL